MSAPVGDRGRGCDNGKKRFVVLIVLCALASLGLAMSPAARATPLPLGTVALTSDTDSTCPAGHTCQGIAVSCPNVQRPARAFLATADPTAPTRGLVVLATGGGGTSWWSEASSLAGSFVDTLRADGFVVVQLRWVDQWLASAPGEDAGSGHLACRPATVFRWVHDNQFLPLGFSASAIGRCGYCITGNSGGASQVSYALSFYGLDSILDAVIPTSGPPHAAQAKGCLRDTNNQAYWYDTGASAIIDSSYGFAAGQGPCALHDSSFVPRWDAESVDTGGNDFVYPHTRVVIILGGQDTSSAPPHARDFANKLALAGTPFLNLQVVPNMGHPIQQSSDGLSALHAALLAVGDGYARPKGATPTLVSLALAYDPCASPNEQHGEPLSSGSCNPPEQSSKHLTVGTPDANGEKANAVGKVRFDVFDCPACVGPGPNEDVRINFSLTDVRNNADLSDYTGELQASVLLRITDRDNGPTESDPATTVDLPFGFAVSCSATSDTTVGSTCALATSVEALVPGAIKPDKRAIWQLGQVKAYDGGSDGVASTTTDNTLFMDEGIFVP